MRVRAEAYLRPVEEWDAFPAYDIIWTDPPWGEGMMQLFKRMATMAGGCPPAGSLAGALDAMFRLADSGRPMFVAYGVKGGDLPLAIADRRGHRLDRVSRCVQENGKPYVVFNFNSTSYAVRDGARGFDAVRETVRALRPAVVFDPFAGMGRTAAAVLGEGCGYIGSEMNVARHAKLAKVVARAAAS